MIIRKIPKSTEPKKLYLVALINEEGKILLLKDKKENKLLLPSSKPKPHKSFITVLDLKVPKRTLKSITKLADKNVFLYSFKIKSEQIGENIEHLWVSKEDILKGKKEYFIPIHKNKFKLSQFLLNLIQGVFTENTTIELFKKTC